MTKTIDMTAVNETFTLLEQSMLMRIAQNVWQEIGPDLTHANEGCELDDDSIVEIVMDCDRILGRVRRTPMAEHMRHTLLQKVQGLGDDTKQLEPLVRVALGFASPSAPQRSYAKGAAVSFPSGRFGQERMFGVVLASPVVPTSSMTLVSVGEDLGPRTVRTNRLQLMPVPSSNPQCASCHRPSFITDKESREPMCPACVVTCCCPECGTRIRYGTDQDQDGRVECVVCKHVWRI